MCSSLFILQSVFEVMLGYAKICLVMLSYARLCWLGYGKVKVRLCRLFYVFTQKLGISPQAFFPQIAIYVLYLFIMVSTAWNPQKCVEYTMYSM